METLKLTNDPWRRMQARNLTRDIDALESEMVRVAMRQHGHKARKAMAKIRAQLSALAVKRAALFSEA